MSLESSMPHVQKISSKPSRSGRLVESSRTVVLLATATLAVVGAVAFPSGAGAADAPSTSIPIGADLYAIAAAPDGSVYTANAGNAVTRIAGAGTSAQTVTSIPVGSAGSVAVAPDGTVFTANSDSTVSRIASPGAADQAVTSIPLGQAVAAVAIAVAPDGTVYTANASNTITRIAAAGTLQQSVSTITAGTQRLGSIAVGPDGTVYATPDLGASLNTTAKIVRVMGFGTPDQRVTVIDTGLRNRVASYGVIAVTPDNTVFVGYRTVAGLIQVSNPTSATPTFSTFRTGGADYSLTADADGSLYMPGLTGEVLKVTDPAISRRVVTGAAVPPSPLFVAVTGDGTVYTANRDDTVTRLTRTAFTARSPEFTAATPQGAVTVGSAYSYTFTAGPGTSATTTARFALAAGDTLPAGLTLDATSGVLSGTPTTPGVTSFRVVASNSYGTATTNPITITVAPAPVAPAFTASSPAATATVGSAYSYTFAASGVPAPSFALVPGDALPAGLTLDATSGVLSGTPTTAETSTFRVVASNSSGTATTNPITITVAPAPVAPAFTASSPAATATVGSAYSYTFAASGVPAPSFALVPGDALPAGLTLDATSGVLSGTPTTAETSTFRVVASNSYGTATTNSITITVAPAAVQLLATPTITSPESGEQVSNPVTFTGTGTPGDFIALITYPSATPPQSSQPVDDAFAATNSIRVGADGTWTATRPLDPGATSAFAVAFTRDAAGGITNTSAPSPLRTFTVAAPASTPVGASPSAAPRGDASADSSAGELAFTGVEDASLKTMAGIAALLAAAGTGLVTIRHRKATRRR
ncbi:putative Ig domain-containing protein [Frigoribacterium sp. 2-23]|uniref:putative Ig domain-containing protein n=1 Tax=Frigoribacterium sp. 2-23 TaxID=3415006 RepID=UPI003C6FC899